MNRKDIAAGLLLLAMGAFALFAGRGLALTNFEAMGPGYFPRALASLLCVLGVLILANGLRKGRTAAPGLDADAGGTPWRAIAFISLALLWFGLTVRVLGLGPAPGRRGAAGVRRQPDIPPVFQRGTGLRHGAVLVAGVRVPPAHAGAHAGHLVEMTWNCSTTSPSVLPPA